jgi:outer membrane protein assembly factor BamB
MMQMRSMAMIWCAAVSVWIGSGCDRDEAAPAAPPPARAGVATIRTGDWPIYRGDRAMTGVAQGHLADRLELAWRYGTGGPIESSPVVADGRVYIGSGDGLCYALSLADGELLWRRRLGEAADLPGIEAPPMVHDGMVYVGNTIGTLAALDAQSGAVKWTFRGEGAGKFAGAANHATLADGRKVILVGNYDSGSLYCLDVTTGQRVWTFVTDQPVNGAPAIDARRGLVVFGGCDGHIYALDLDTGERAGLIDVGHPNPGTVALHGGTAYLGHYGNALVAADMQAGEIRWTWTSPDRPMPIFGAAATDGRRVVFGGRDRSVHCVDARSGEGIWHFATGGKVDSSPVIVGDRVVAAGDDGRVYLLGLDDGRRIWSYEVGQAIVASPAVAGSYVIVGSKDGAVYGFVESRRR